MRHDQGTGLETPYWSIVASGEQRWWPDRVTAVLNETPAWVLTVTAGALLIALLVLGYLVMSRVNAQRAQQAQERKEALAQGRPVPAEPLKMDYKPLIGGIAVSLYGLWGFARDPHQLDLPLPFAIGFISMFDVLELHLFASMYRSADPEKGWTRSLRMTRFGAWCFVVCSAVANIAHAPNAISAPFMALMPLGAAFVIDLDLRRALAGKMADEELQGTKPGPFRLAALSWRRLWAWGFRKAGLDVNDRADEMVRRARARDAADASYELRKALQEKETLEKVVGNAGVPGRRRGKVSEEQKRLDALNKALEKKIRPKAQVALEMADTQDPEQGLQLMQRMAWLTRADDVALLDYGPDSPAMQVLEELNIAANADFIKSRARAREEEQKATEATERAQRAARDLERLREELEALTGRLDEARQEEEREANRIRVLNEERKALERSGSSAQQLYQRTVSELEEQRAKTEQLQTHLGNLEGEYKALQTRMDGLVGERDRLVSEAEQAKEAAREANEEMVSLRSRLALFEELAAEESAGQPAGAVPAARAGGEVVQARVGGETSTGAKIAGFQLLEQQYLALPVEERVTLSASELARRWWEAAGLTEQTTRKYIGDIKKMHDKTDTTAESAG